MAELFPDNSAHDREKRKFDSNNRVRTLGRDELLQSVEDGLVFMNSHSELLAGAATDYHAFTTPSASTATVAVYFSIAADLGPMTIRMFEGATLSSLGAIEPSFNLNRISTNPAMSVFSSVPTIVANGTQIWIKMVSGGKEGAAGGGGLSMYLLPSTTYLFGLTNGSNQAAHYSMELLFTEKPVVL